MPVEPALGALGDGDLVALLAGEVTLGGDGEHVLLHRQVDRRRVDARYVEVHHEVAVAPVGVHRHHRPGRAPGSLGEAVELPERVEAHQHRNQTSCVHPHAEFVA